MIVRRPSRGSVALFLTLGVATLASLSPMRAEAASSPATNANFVSHAYVDILGRPADDAGLAYWSAALNAGTGRGQLGAAFTASTEYKADVVAAAYQEFLGRAPDAGGSAYYTGLLLNGSRTDEDLAVELVGSPEFSSVNSSNTAFVNALYTHVLHRPADQGGLDHYAGVLGGSTSRKEVASILVRSQERYNFVVNSIYVHYLRRDADPEGLAYWTSVRTAGFQDERIITQFVGSVEYSQYVIAH